MGSVPHLLVLGDSVSSEDSGSFHRLFLKDPDSKPGEPYGVLFFFQIFSFAIGMGKPPQTIYKQTSWA